MSVTCLCQSVSVAVPTSMTGSTTGPLDHAVDARWTMAYSAALDDHLDCYFDTRREGGIVAHPLFPVCPEWPVIVSWGETSVRAGVQPDEARRGVHATHDLTIHRLVRPGDRLTTTMTVTGVERRRPGAFATMRLDTVDGEGRPVATTEQGSLYLGVPTAGEDRPAAPAAEPLVLPAPGDTALDQWPVAVGAGAAHVYSECARIWNPIHTDAAVAAAAGLPGLILHGTATLAHAVSQVVRHEAGGDPGRVRRVSGRFGAMVMVPSALLVRVLARVQGQGGETAVQFDVRTGEGAAAVDCGVIVLD